VIRLVAILSVLRKPCRRGPPAPVGFRRGSLRQAQRDPHL